MNYRGIAPKWASRHNYKRFISDEDRRRLAEARRIARQKWREEHPLEAHLDDLAAHYMRILAQQLYGDGDPDK